MNFAVIIVALCLVQYSNSAGCSTCSSGSAGASIEASTGGSGGGGKGNKHTKQSSSMAELVCSQVDALDNLLGTMTWWGHLGIDNAGNMGGEISETIKRAVFGTINAVYGARGHIAQGLEKGLHHMINTMNKIMVVVQGTVLYVPTWLFSCQ